MRIIIYVEGPSDKLAMEELLSSLLNKLQQRGIAVEFFSTEGKKRLMTQTPIKAINILRNDPKAVVIALPDLYPPNIGFKHTTFKELTEVLQCQFKRELERKGLGDTELSKRFLVFCFKHDLESLVLAAEKELASRLGLSALNCTWTKPVEDQNHGQPPKRIVEDLFYQNQEWYKDTVDAPLILGATRYHEIAMACPQCFKPFVDYLESSLQEYL